MKKLYMMFTIGVIIIIFLVFYLGRSISEKIEQIDSSLDDKKDAIGMIVVLQHDTVMVTSYDMWANEYGMSNGADISADLLPHLEVLTSR